jgi:CubicO group peptidase (beta-lactamase class C family)
MKQSQTEVLKNWSVSWLEQQRRSYQIPGLAFVIFNNKEVLVKSGLGYADLEFKTKVDAATTMFRVASISKSITALALVKLWQDGKLELDDQIGKYLNIGKIGKLQIKSLLSHTSGLRRDGLLPFWDNDDFPDQEGLFEEARAKGVEIFAQDRKYKYSNFAYALLGKIIEKVSGKSYDEYLKQEIIFKLDLKNTFSDVVGLKAQERKKLATGYGRILTDGGLLQTREKFDEIITKAYAPAVGFATSALDLSRIAQQLFLKNEEILSSKVKQVMLKPRKVEKHPDDTYALGVKTWKSGNNQLLGHGGSFAGFRSYYALCPKYSIGAVVLTNSMNDRAKSIVEALIDMTIKVKVKGAGSAKLQIFEGMFENRWSDIQIISMGDTLYYYDLDSNNPANDLIKLEQKGRGFIDEHAPGGDYKGEGVEYVFNSRGSIRYLKWGSTILYPKYWK